MAPDLCCIRNVSVCVSPGRYNRAPVKPPKACHQSRAVRAAKGPPVLRGDQEVKADTSKSKGATKATPAAPKSAANPDPGPSAKPSRRRKRGGSGNAAGSAEQ